MAIKTNGFLKGSLPEELMQILVTLASSWEDVDNPNEIQVKHLSGAMTNEVFQIVWPNNNKKVVNVNNNKNNTKVVNDHDGVDRKVLLRIYGEGVDIFFDRNEEIRTFECMSHHGHGPRLLGRFPDGRVEEFIHARTLSADDLRDPEISGLIASKMRDFHDLDMPGPKAVFLWNRLRNWLKKANNLCSPKDIKALRLDILAEEIDLLEKELVRENQDVGFCHNDLQYGNIMIDEKARSITLIDYEYASYNPVAYDLANHFCEMVADYHSETPHILDYTKYPGLEERQRFVRAYLSSSGDKPSEAQVEQLVEDAEKYTLANHLFWGLWGIISAYVNNIDFDYKEYARQRLQQYWLRKPALLLPPTSVEDPTPNAWKKLVLE